MIKGKSVESSNREEGFSSRILMKQAKREGDMMANDTQITG